jgi:hypothetical protein
MSGLRIAWRLLAGLLLTGLPVVAQLQVGNNVKMKLNGDLSMGYNASFGDQVSSSHDFGLGGDGILSGYYYNPAFLSFSSRSYYDRSQTNSAYQSVGNTSGVDNTVNIFTGSHFPGGISYSKTYDSTGVFGVPGQSGLLSHGDGTSFGIGWGAFLEGLPSLQVNFSKQNSASSIYGTSATNDNSSHTFTMSSNYKLAGFQLNGTYLKMTSDMILPAALQVTSTESAGFTKAYLFNVSHPFPLHGAFSAGFNRSVFNYTYKSAGDGGPGSATDGSSDSVNTSIAIHPLDKLSAAFLVNYNDNLSGTIAQQVINAGGQAPETSFGKLKTLNASSTIYWQALHNVSFNAGVNRQEQYFQGTTLGYTQFNGTVNFNYARPLFGVLYFSVGAVDTASQTGNGGVGLIGNVSFSRKLDRFEISGNLSYSQNVETLVGVSTTSSYTYGVNVTRKFGTSTYWNAAYGGGHSGFSVAGSDSSSSRYSTGISRHGYGATVNYSQSNGASLLTANGLISIPAGLPPGLITSNVVIYNGKSFGASASGTLFRKILISGAYSEASGATISPQLSTKSNSQMFTSMLRYPYRKVYITAGFTRFNQGISSSSGLPAMISSYYFGISRWFNIF